MTDYISIPALPVLYLLSQVVPEGSSLMGAAIVSGAMGLLIWIAKQERTERRQIAQEFRESMERHIDVIQENTEAIKSFHGVVTQTATKEDIRKLAESTKCAAIHTDKFERLERRIDSLKPSAQH